MPTVDEKNPGDQNSLCQYTFLIHVKRLRISRLVLALIFPIISEIEYFGGITMIKCTWSFWTLYFSISISGWCFWMSPKCFSINRCRSPFNILLRYFGIQTTWNSWWYAPWALSLISMTWAYHIRALFPAFGWDAFTHGLTPVVLSVVLIGNNYLKPMWFFNAEKVCLTPALGSTAGHFTPPLRHTYSADHI